MLRPIASLNYRQGEVPVQLLAIARMLTDDCDIKLINTEIGLSKKTTNQVKQEIEPYLDGCLLFGLTVMTGYAIKEALAVSRFVRKRSPETKIVWGGWHASLLPEQTLREADIDFVVAGQGEFTIRELVSSLQEKETDFSSILGLGWKDGERLIINPPRPLSNINNFPLLPFHMLEDEFFGQKYEERTAAMVTSVGCPLDCGFCADRAVYGGKWNRLSADRTLKELKTLRDDYGVTGVRILDSNFLCTGPATSKFLKACAIWA